GSGIGDQVKKFASKDASIQAAGKIIAEAQNLIVMFGDERTVQDNALAQACANLVVATGHIGKANNGLLPLWAHANTQGVYDMLSATGATGGKFDGAKVLYVVAADPIGDGVALPKADFTIVQELFLTATAKQADVVLPALSWAERDGTLINAERRVQRFYKAIPPQAQARADWEVFSQVAERLGLNWKYFTPETVMEEIAATVPAYAGLTYAALAVTREEWPPVGSNDLYFGGTAYDNRGGIGAQAKSLVELDGQSVVKWIEPSAQSSALKVRQLNRHGTLIDQSAVYQVRLAEAESSAVKA
nr:molybdopterin-dependent oxidoreductase [Thermoflexales bacterium]